MFVRVHSNVGVFEDYIWYLQRDREWKFLLKVASQCRERGVWFYLILPVSFSILSWQKKTRDDKKNEGRRAKKGGCWKGGECLWTNHRSAKWSLFINISSEITVNPPQLICCRAWWITTFLDCDRKTIKGKRRRDQGESGRQQVTWGSQSKRALQQSGRLSYIFLPQWTYCLGVCVCCGNVEVKPFL